MLQSEHDTDIIMLQVLDHLHKANGGLQLLHKDVIVVINAKSSRLKQAAKTRVLNLDT